MLDDFGERERKEMTGKKKKKTLQLDIIIITVMLYGTYKQRFTSRKCKRSSNTGVFSRVWIQILMMTSLAGRESKSKKEKEKDFTVHKINNGSVQFLMVLQGLFVLNRSPSSPLPRVNQQFPLSFL